MRIVGDSAAAVGRETIGLRQAEQAALPEIHPGGTRPYEILAAFDTAQFRGDTGTTGHLEPLPAPVRPQFQNIRLQGEQPVEIWRRRKLAQGHAVTALPVVLQGLAQRCLVANLPGVDLEHDIGGRQATTLEDRLINQAMLALDGLQVA